MGKKIIVLNGSPRKNGNTSALVKAFREGAESAGHSVTEFWLEGMKINGCRGCCAGGNNPESPCVQKDDMEQIYPAYKEADVVVLASPLYYWTISGQLKCAFDRLFAVAEVRPELYEPAQGERAADGGRGQRLRGDRLLVRPLMGHIGWKDCGKVLCGGVMAVGDIEGKPELEEARRLGASIK